MPQEVRGPESTAACDTHLSMLLSEVIQPTTEGANVTLPTRITRLETPDPTYVCLCREPATWYVLRLSARRSLSRVRAVLNDVDVIGRYLDTERTTTLARDVINATLS